MVSTPVHICVKLSRRLKLVLKLVRVNEEQRDARWRETCVGDWRYIPTVVRRGGVGTHCRREENCHRGNSVTVVTRIFYIEAAGEAVRFLNIFKLIFN